MHGDAARYSAFHDPTQLRTLIRATRDDLREAESNGNTALAIDLLAEIAELSIELEAREHLPAPREP